MNRVRGMVAARSRSRGEPGAASRSPSPASAIAPLSSRSPARPRLPPAATGTPLGRDTALAPSTYYPQTMTPAARVRPHARDAASPVPPRSAAAASLARSSSATVTPSRGGGKGALLPLQHFTGPLARVVEAFSLLGVQVAHTLTAMEHMTLLFALPPSVRRVLVAPLVAAVRARSSSVEAPEPAGVADVPPPAPWQPARSTTWPSWSPAAVTLNAAMRQPAMGARGRVHGMLQAVVAAEGAQAAEEEEDAPVPPPALASPPAPGSRATPARRGRSETSTRRLVGGLPLDLRTSDRHARTPPASAAVAALPHPPRARSATPSSASPSRRAGAGTTRRGSADSTDPAAATAAPPSAQRRRASLEPRDITAADVLAALGEAADGAPTVPVPAPRTGRRRSSLELRSSGGGGGGYMQLLVADRSPRVGTVLAAEVASLLRHARTSASPPHSRQPVTAASARVAAAAAAAPTPAPAPGSPAPSRFAAAVAAVASPAALRSAARRGSDGPPAPAVEARGEVWTVRATPAVAGVGSPQPQPRPTGGDAGRGRRPAAHAIDRIEEAIIEQLMNDRSLLALSGVLGPPTVGTCTAGTSAPPPASEASVQQVADIIAAAIAGVTVPPPSAPTPIDAATAAPVSTAIPPDAPPPPTAPPPAAPPLTTPPLTTPPLTTPPAAQPTASPLPAAPLSRVLVADLLASKAAPRLFIPRGTTMDALPATIRNPLTQHNWRARAIATPVRLQ